MISPREAVDRRLVALTAPASPNSSVCIHICPTCKVKHSIPYIEWLYREQARLLYGGVESEIVTEDRNVYLVRDTNYGVLHRWEDRSWGERT